MDEYFKAIKAEIEKCKQLNDINLKNVEKLDVYVNQVGYMIDAILKQVKKIKD